jgi:hypothetical protein
MSVNQYSPCPCGIGRKIKFCKCEYGCSEQLGDVQKITRMLAGDQNVAALDRINQLLKSYPAAPWLLALKCEAAMKLNEIDLLEETSATFLRHNPKNPLALSHRSLVATIRGTIPEAANLLHQALAASDESIPEWLPRTMMLFLESCVDRQLLLSVNRMTLAFGQYAADNPVIPELCDRIRMELLRTGSNPLLSDNVPEPPLSIDGEHSAAFEQAMTLITSLRVEDGKRLLEKLLRSDAPKLPVLLGLLHCRFMLADEAGAAEICLRLGKDPSVDQAQRIYFLTLAMLLDPIAAGVSSPVQLVEYPIPVGQETETRQRLFDSIYTRNRSVEREDRIAAFRCDPPPADIFMLIHPRGLQLSIPDDEPLDIELQLGDLIGLIGRQTTEPARLRIWQCHTPLSDVPRQRLLDELGLSGVEAKTIVESPRAFWEVAFPGAALAPAENRKIDQERYLPNLRQQYISQLCQCPLEILGGATLLQAAGNPEHAIAIQAILLALESQPSDPIDLEFLALLRHQIQLPAPVLPVQPDPMEQVGAAAFFWVDLTGLAPTDLLSWMTAAYSQRVTGSYPRLMEHSRVTAWSPELQPLAEILTMNLALPLTRRLEDRLALIDQLIETSLAPETPDGPWPTPGQWVISKCQLLNRVGRPDEAQRFMAESFKKMPNDPFLLEVVKMAQAQMTAEMLTEAQGRPSPATRRPAAASAGLASASPSPPAASSSDSGLVLPGSPAAQATEGSGGAGKLWLPGQG